MGKSSKYPSYSSGTVTLNGNTVASTSKKGNTVNSTYNMPETEKNIYDYAQNSFLTSLPQINVFSNDTRKDINSQLEAYKNRGVQTINDIYDPIMDDLKNDVASRFGNLNNSIFMDNLNDIEENRAAAISDLAQDIEAQRSSLYNNELTQRYNYLNFLNDIQNQINNNALNYMGLSQSNSPSGNSYNQNAYNANLQRYQLPIETAIKAGMLASKFTA